MIDSHSALKFSGHQTFPIRYGWIYKIIQEIKEGNSIISSANIEKQMGAMGMGKNMVQSIRYWIRELGLVTVSSNSATLTPLASNLFGDSESLDPYLDHVGTLWLLHWLMISDLSQMNSFKWFFNYCNEVRIDKELLTRIIQLQLESHPKKPTDSTLKKDIDCFFQTYGSRQLKKGKLTEDSFLCPFNELGLLQAIDSKQFLAEFGNMNSLPAEVFYFAIVQFMQKQLKESNQKTISFDALLNQPGSPGRVFRLTSSGLSQKLDALESLTQSTIRWTDTQGLRQIEHRFDDINSEDPTKYLEHYYSHEAIK